MRRFLLTTFGIAVVGIWFVPIRSEVAAQIGRGRGERVEDRIERRVERQMNRNQRGFYFNDAVWAEAQPWFEQYQIGPVNVRIGAPARTQYGFVDATPDDDWYYDYYDVGYRYYYPAQGTVHAHGYQYYDWNGDGVYDVSYRVYDQDNDGYYDNSDEYYFGAKEIQPPKDSGIQLSYGSASVDIRGEIVGVKKVRVRGSEHLVLNVQDGSAEKTKTIAVDAGPASAAKVRLNVGDEVSVMGRMIDVGEKSILVAERIEINGQKIEVTHASQPITGSIVETKTVEVHGTPHLWVVINTGSGHQMVDLGVASELKVDLTPKTEITIHGVPVQLKDRPILLAHSVVYNDRTINIPRPMLARRGDDRNRN
jgi:hypothetical protein